MFVVTSGTFELRHELANGESRVETTIPTGGVFGLTSMLDDGPRRSSAYAVTDGTCLALTRMTFRQAIIANPALAVEVMRATRRSAERPRAGTALELSGEQESAGVVKAIGLGGRSRRAVAGHSESEW